MGLDNRRGEQQPFLECSFILSFSVSSLTLSYVVPFSLRALHFVDIFFLLQCDQYPDKRAVAGDIPPRGSWIPGRLGSALFPSPQSLPVDSLLHSCLFPSVSSRSISYVPIVSKVTLIDITFAWIYRAQGGVSRDKNLVLLCVCVCVCVCMCVCV